MNSPPSKRPSRSGSSRFSSSTTTATFSSFRARSGGRESSARRTCSSKVNRRGGGRPFREENRPRHPKHEPPHVREDGDAAALGRMREVEPRLPELEQEVDPEEEDRRDLAQEEDEAEEDRGQHAGAREDDEICAEHARNRAGRAEVRD